MLKKKIAARHDTCHEEPEPPKAPPNQPVLDWCIESYVLTVSRHGLALMSGDIWRNDVTKAVARVATHDQSLFPSQRSFPGRGDVYVCDRKQHKKKSDFEFLRKSTRLIRSDPTSIQRVRSAYQPPASSTFLSGQTSHQQSASSTFLSEQISTSHQPPAKRTGCRFWEDLWIGKEPVKVKFPSLYNLVRKKNMTVVTPQVFSRVN
jgi:hypothetical protein